MPILQLGNTEAWETSMGMFPEQGGLLAPAGTSEDALQAWDGSHMLLWAERVLSHLRRDTPRCSEGGKNKRKQKVASLSFCLSPCLLLAGSNKKDGYCLPQGLRAKRRRDVIPCFSQTCISQSLASAWSSRALDHELSPRPRPATSLRASVRHLLPWRPLRTEGIHATSLERWFPKN